MQVSRKCLFTVWSLARWMGGGFPLHLMTLFPSASLNLRRISLVPPLSWNSFSQTAMTVLFIKFQKSNLFFQEAALVSTPEQAGERWGVVRAITWGCSLPQTSTPQAFSTNSCILYFPWSHTLKISARMHTHSYTEILPHMCTQSRMPILFHMHAIIFRCMSVPACTCMVASPLKKQWPFAFVDDDFERRPAHTVIFLPRTYHLYAILSSVGFHSRRASLIGRALEWEKQLGCWARVESTREQDSHNGPIINGDRWLFSRRGLWKPQEWKRSKAVGRAGCSRSFFRQKAKDSHCG